MIPKDVGAEVLAITKGPWKVSSTEPHSIQF